MIKISSAIKLVRWIYCRLVA